MQKGFRGKLGHVSRGDELERVDASTRDACAFCDSVIAAVILYRLPQVPWVVPSPTPHSLNMSLLSEPPPSVPVIARHSGQQLCLSTPLRTISRPPPSLRPIASRVLEQAHYPCDVTRLLTSEASAFGPNQKRLLAAGSRVGSGSKTSFVHSGVATVVVKKSRGCSLQALLQKPGWVGQLCNDTVVRGTFSCEYILTNNNGESLERLILFL